MDCSKVLESLSTYVDGALDSDARTQVEEHLAACEGCRSELHALRACVQAVHSLERIPAPPGFLERVRECIDRPPLWKRMLQTLLLPLHLKLPLHLAGAAAMVLLIFATIPFTRFQEKPRETVGTPPPQMPEQRALRGSVPMKEPEEKPAGEPGPPKAAGVDAIGSATEASPLQLVLVIPRKGTPAERVPPAEENATGPIPSQHAGESPRGKGVQAAPDHSRPPHAAAPQATASSPPRAQLEERLSRPRKDERAGRIDAASKPEEESPPVRTAREQRHIPESPGTKVSGKEAGGVDVGAHGALERWITDAGGTIQHKEPDIGNALSCSIVASIPAQFYPALLGQLRLLGELRNPPSSFPPPGNEGMVFVRITLTAGE